MAADQRRSPRGVNVSAPAARSARTNDVEAVKARRILGWPGEPCQRRAVTAAGRRGDSPSLPPSKKMNRQGNPVALRRQPGSSPSRLGGSRRACVFGHFGAAGHLTRSAP